MLIQKRTFIDNSCGDGQFLSEVLIRKLESGIDFEQALKTIYGVDLMPDNVKTVSRIDCYVAEKILDTL